MAFPNDIPAFGADVVNGQTILPAHINDIRQALILVSKTLASDDTSGLVDPATINDAIAQANYAAAITVNAVKRVGGVLDVLASQIRKINGGALTWLDTPAADLTKLSTPDYITLTSQTGNAPNSKSLSTVVLKGLDASIPAAGTLAIGAIYFATDTGIEYRNNGTSWDRVAISTPDTLVNGNVLKFDGTKLTPVSPPAVNQYLFNDAVGIRWADFPANYQIINSVAVFDPTDYSFEFFNSIQSAINTLTSGEIIFLQPGVYNEKLTIGSNMPVYIYEAIPGSVTFNYVPLTGAGSTPFIVLTTGLLHVEVTSFNIRFNDSVVGSPTVGIEVIGASTLEIKARTINAELNAASGTYYFVSCEGINFIQTINFYLTEINYIFSYVLNTGTAALTFLYSNNDAPKPAVSFIVVQATFSNAYSTLGVLTVFRLSLDAVLRIPLFILVNSPKATSQNFILVANSTLATVSMGAILTPDVSSAISNAQFLYDNYI